LTGTMLKWFAPLLVFTAKPEVMLRALTLVIAGGILAFGVWLLSNVALTFDALKNPYIAAIYAIVLACFFIGVGAVTWLRVRRLTQTQTSRPQITVAEAPPLPNEVVSRRAEAISKKWFRDNHRVAANAADTALVPAVTPPSPRHAGMLRGSLTVTGPAFSGKTALITSLVRETSRCASEKIEIVRLVDAGPVDGDDTHLSSLAAGVATADGILFVIDQDLRAPEVRAIARLAAGGKPLYVVLNKADQFAAAERDAILLSVRAKMPAKFPPSHVISVAAAPSSVEREIEDARGTVRVELRRPPSDVRSLTTLLGRVRPGAPGKSLTFEAA
jgi:hypothetical protein